MRLTGALLGGFLAAPVGAVVIESLSFQHKDWALVCDNTRTCRAEGYQSDGVDAPSEPVSMLVTRVAGPGSLATIDLRLATDIEPKRKLRSPYQVLVGKLRLTGLFCDAEGVIHLTPEQVTQIGPELPRQREVRVVSANGQMEWRLSLEGAYAVLLKMDETQGRLDTPGALVRRGMRPEATVLPPLAPPVVRGAVPLVDSAGEKGLARRIWASVEGKQFLGDCNETDPPPEPVLYRLTRNKVLLAVPCALGAYNHTQILLMAQDTLPYKVTRLDANGEFDPATGSVRLALKGRGLGDCWSITRWQFDGDAFLRSGESGSTMCRGFVGGAWPMPWFVTRVETQSAASPR